MSLQERRSSPRRVEHRRRTEAEKAATQSQARKRLAQPKHPASQGRPGRPQGRKNREKTPSVLSPALQRIHPRIQPPLSLINGSISLSDTVLDGHCGNHLALHMVRGVGLQLISKLRHDAALSVPYDGPYAGRGPRRKDGSNLDDRHIPVQYLQETTVEGNIHTNISQATMWNKELVTPLNVVIMVKIHLKTQARAHGVLCSRDMAFSDDQLIDYDRLRFHIELNFRDATQYWGLEDLMNVQPTAVTHAARVALFLVNVAHLLLQPCRKDHPQFGILDLKADCRGHTYVAET